MASAGFPVIVERLASIRSSKINILGTLFAAMAMLSSHLPSAFMRNIEPSILHFISAA
jgi:hypothetical protein